MSNKITRIAQTFLNEMSTGEVNDAFDILKHLIYELEEKADPDPIEVRLLANLCHFLEKYEIMKHNLQSYVRDFNHDLPGNVLSDLYRSLDTLE